MALSGLWGHLLSHSNDNLFERAFHGGLRSKLSLAVGAPVPPQQATPAYLYDQVHALRERR